jgi:hypothetical protein
LQETRTIPIVFAILADPVGSSFVASLARPGGNATGFVVMEGSLGGKRLELLKAGLRAAHSGRHNCNLGEDQQQNSQPLRNAKQANSGPYRSDHDCIISQRNRCVGFLSYQHHSAPCPSNNHGDPHDSDHYGKDASKHGSPPSCLTIS